MKSPQDVGLEYLDAMHVDLRRLASIQEAQLEESRQIAAAARQAASEARHQTEILRTMGRRVFWIYVLAILVLFAIVASFLAGFLSGMAEVARNARLGH